MNLIDLLSKWLVNEYPMTKWRTDDYGYVVAFSEDELYAIVWINTNDNPIIDIEWWFNKWEHSSFLITNPIFFEDIKKYLDKVLPIAKSYFQAFGRQPTP